MERAYSLAIIVNNRDWQWWRPATIRIYGLYKSFPQGNAGVEALLLGTACQTQIMAVQTWWCVAKALALGWSLSNAGGVYGTRADDQLPLLCISQRIRVTCPATTPFWR